MAVYKRTYRPYDGAMTPDWSRWFVLTRYALQTLFQSRLLIGLIVASFLFPLFGLGMIYLRHNLSTLALFGLSSNQIMNIDSSFFAAFLSVQGTFAFLLVAYAGPGLIAPDISNNALPLYLYRPITRAEYVLGKMAVLFVPLSFITWIPGLFLVITQAGLEPGWIANNGHLPAAIFVGSWIWILLLSVLALALSAWVKWKLAASALLFGVFFISSAFSEIVNEVLETKLGYLLNMGHVVGMIWAQLLQIAGRRTMLTEMLNLRQGDELPMWAAYLAVAILCAFCLLLLNRKLRGREVVS